MKLRSAIRLKTTLNIKKIKEQGMSLAGITDQFK